MQTIDELLDCATFDRPIDRIIMRLNLQPLYARIAELEATLAAIRASAKEQAYYPREYVLVARAALEGQRDA